MSDLNIKWKNMGYSKWSGPEHHLEFAIVEALLWEKIDIKYVSTSESEYPLFPKDHEEATAVLEKAILARKIRKLFLWPERQGAEGFRSYIGRIADEFNKFSEKELLIPDPFNRNEELSYIAADRFVVLSMDNRTYEEDDIFGN